MFLGTRGLSLELSCYSITALLIPVDSPFHELKRRVNSGAKQLLPGFPLCDITSVAKELMNYPWPLGCLVS